jgi:hypothetical protein
MVMTTPTGKHTEQQVPSSKSRPPYEKDDKKNDDLEDGGIGCRQDTQVDIGSRRGSFSRFHSKYRSISHLHLDFSILLSYTINVRSFAVCSALSRSLDTSFYR